MEQIDQHKEGWRDRKRRQTLERIAKNGLRLFVENGYDATTLEAIAEASDISPRTFFYYFKTKDEVLRFWQGGGMIEALGPALRQQSGLKTPMAAVRDCLLELVSRFETEKSVDVDRVLNSTEALRSRKQAIFYQMEIMVFEALCTLWPEPERRRPLRAVAMISIGALRLAMEAQRQDNDTGPLVEYLSDSFAMLEDPSSLQ
jgi:AcrR family transcriptional regulator